jgi:hypothetical protein
MAHLATIYGRIHIPGQNQLAIVISANLFGYGMRNRFDFIPFACFFGVRFRVLIAHERLVGVSKLSSQAQNSSMQRIINCNHFKR